MNRLAKCALIACGMALGACQGESGDTVISQAPRIHYSDLLQLDQTAPRHFISTGSVVSDQRIEISSRLSGYVRQLKVKEGDKVQAGALLAQMDAADVEGAIRQAQAVVSAALAAQKVLLRPDSIACIWTAQGAPVQSSIGRCNPISVVTGLEDG